MIARNRSLATTGVIFSAVLLAASGPMFSQAPAQPAPAAAQRDAGGAPAAQATPAPQPGSTAGPQGAPGSRPAAPVPAAPTDDRRPRAKSQEELDAYQKFTQEKNPDEQIKLIEDFLLQFPDTQLKEYAYQAATQAYQTKNDYEKVLTYGELTLAQNERNLIALLMVSSAIPERTAKNDIDREEKLQQAETFANRGLEVLSKLAVPPNLTEEQWTQIKMDAEATPHAALGMIAMIREDFPKAEAEFRMAIEMSSKPDPVVLYRLGLCYSFEKKLDAAIEALDRSAASGGVKVPGPAGVTRDLVAEAREYVVKSKAAADTPVSGTPTASGAQTTAQP